VSSRARRLSSNEAVVTAGWYVEAVKSSKACRGDFRGLVSRAVGDLVCRCALLRSAIKKRFGCKCVRFGIPFSRDHEIGCWETPGAGSTLPCAGSDVLLRTFARRLTGRPRAPSQEHPDALIPRLRASMSPSMRARYSATVLMRVRSVWRAQQLVTVGSLRTTPIAP